MTAGRPFISFSDLHKAARRRLPRLLFDAIESGVEDELGLQRNVEAFSKHVLYPRQMLDVRLRSQKTTLFEQSYSTPIGIAPTGLAGMFRHGAESMLAEAAERCDVPYILSGACIEEMEQVIAIAPERIWFQIYAAKNTRVTSDLMRRAEQAGVNTLVLTVDTPVLPKRERDMRNGFGLPLRPSPLLFLESLLHPRWIAHYFYHGGLPLMKTWARYLPDRTGPAETFSYFREQSPSVQTWRDLDAFRMLWKGRLVVKGLQHPDDARLAADSGVDGIIVSNHGGKAMDKGPAPIDALPAVAAAVGHRVTVMMDSGIRRGSDVVIARCLGAKFVFAGRGPLYGVIARGMEGAAQSIEILRDEVDRTLGLIGCPDAANLGPQYLHNHSHPGANAFNGSQAQRRTENSPLGVPPLAPPISVPATGGDYEKYPNIYAD